MQRLVGLVRRCADDYQMLPTGETVAVGVSGGKDSLVLLTLLAALRQYHPSRFRLEAFTVDLGFPEMDFTPVEDYCRSLDVPWHRVETEIAAVVFRHRREKNPCSMCAKMRRAALANAAVAAGIRTVALGHHYDDAVETFLLNLFYEGRIACFEPKTYLDRTGVTQIRPLLYLGEKSVAGLAERLTLPVVKNPCPMDKTSKRQEVKTLVETLSRQYPELKTRIFGAMQRLPLPQWEPENAGRRPRPEVEL